MKIIITDTFLKDYNKLVKTTSVEHLIAAIKSIKNIEGIYLQRPLVKLKIKLINLHIRLVGRYVDTKLVFVPILVFKKSDKNRGENISFESISDILENKMIKIDNDLHTKKYEVY